MVFSEADADELVAALGALLAERASSPDLISQIAAEEARRAAEDVAPVAAVYADNAARIYAHAAAGAATNGACGGRPASPAASSAAAAHGSSASGSPTAAAALAAGKAGMPKRKPSLLARVMSWASVKSSDSTTGDFEVGAAAAKVAAAAR